MQTCTWSFLTFSGTFLVRLVVLQDAALMQLDFKLVESSFMVSRVCLVLVPWSPADDRETTICFISW